MMRNQKILLCSMLLVCSTMLPSISAGTISSFSTSHPLEVRDGWELQWSYAFGGNGHAEFAQPFGDIDGDGTMEIIIGGYENDGICRIYSYDSSSESYVEEYSWFVSGGSWHSPSGACVVDLDEDGDLEFCVSWGYSYYDGVYAYTWDGTTLIELDWYHGTGVTFVYDIYTCDYDDDTHPEVLIANDPNAGGIHVSALGWDSDTSSFVYETSWTCPSGSGYAVPMVWSGDVDNDGKTEVIADVSDLNYATAGTWALNWDADTQTWTGVPVCTSYPSGVTVFGDGVGDVDGDGTPEIGVGCYGGTPGGWLFEWDGSAYVQVWHGEYPGQEPVIESVAIGDADNDGAIEFCFGTGAVHVIGWDGSQYYEEATLTGPTNMLAGLNIGDSDSDGLNEIKGCEILGGTGSEFIWQYVIPEAIPPVTTITLEGELVDEVYRSNVTVSLSATDEGSGVLYTKYQLDEGDWVTYTAPFIVSTEGTHTVAYYSVDKAGNIEGEKQATFTILFALPLSVTVTGGKGVTVAITNDGSTAYAHIPYSISIDGGFQLKPKEISGEILLLSPNATAVKTLPVLGLGKITITVTADTWEVTKTGFVFLFFVLRVQ